jgi:hypothetical protein
MTRVRHQYPSIGAGAPVRGGPNDASEVGGSIGNETYCY